MLNSDISARKNEAISQGVGMMTQIYADRSENSEIWDVEDSLAALETLFKADIDPSRVAAIILEPVQGEGGFYDAPREFLDRLVALCDHHGMLLIADKMQTGFAGTGKMFAMDHHPVAAAHAVLDVIEEEKLCDRANMLGGRLKQRLDGMRGFVPEIVDIRGLGFMNAVEFNDVKTNAPSAEFANSVRAHAQKKGLILLTFGVYGNVIRFLAPITIQDEVFNEALEILEASMKAAFSEARSN